jgi:hypothetical protein
MRSALGLQPISSGIHPIECDGPVGDVALHDDCWGTASYPRRRHLDPRPTANEIACLNRAVHYREKAKRCDDPSTKAVYMQWAELWLWVAERYAALPVQDECGEAEPAGRLKTPSPRDRS